MVETFYPPAVFVANGRVELKDQAAAPTLAHKLGDTAHVSGLAIRLARVSGVDDNFPELEDDFPELDIEPPAISLPYIAPPKVGRNDPCPCGSGKKFKKGCGA